MTERKKIVTCFLCLLVIGGLSQAADKPTPAGTWKWKVTRSDNVVVDLSAKLTYVDEKLTGKVTLPNKKEIDIEEATFKDGEVTFTVTQDGGSGRKAVSKYKGKLDGDAIKGKVETTFTPSNRNENNDWEPKREKP